MTVQCKTPKCGRDHELTPPSNGDRKKTSDTRPQVVITCDTCRQTYMYSLQN